MQRNRRRSRRQNSGAGFAIPSANLAAHYDASIGSSITEATGVSVWADLSGNGRNLLQATGADQPVYSAANSSITFDGVSDFLQTAAFTLVQPETMYIVMNQVSWASADYLTDGVNADSGVIVQVTTTPNMIAHAGINSTANTNLAVGADGVACVVFNGASSSFKVNNTTPVSGNFGANDMGGFTLGATTAGTNFGNIIVYEVAIYSVAHSAAKQTEIINGLMQRHGVT